MSGPIGADETRGGAEVQVFRATRALVHAAAEEFARCADAAYQAHGRFSVALAGGSTPAGLYKLLATDAYARRIEWSSVQLFWGDEHCVPPDDPKSNYRMVRESLLKRVPVPEPNVHRIRGESDPSEAAAAYEYELRDILVTPDAGTQPTPRSRFDLILLGMGVDGHTASLFPGTAAVRERERWVLPQYLAAAAMWRVTLTPLLINTAAEIVFLVAGREKAPTLRRVLEGPHRLDALPAQAIAPRAGRLRWLVDSAAAAELERVHGLQSS